MLKKRMLIPPEIETVSRLSKKTLQFYKLQRINQTWFKVKLHFDNPDFTDYRQRLHLAF